MNAIHKRDGPLATGGHAARLLWFWLLVAAWLPSLGCHRSTSPSGPLGPGNVEAQRAQRRQLVDHAIDGLTRLEQFDSPEMLRQIVGRLDEWVKDQEPIAGWEPDPMLATLPESVADVVPTLQLDQLAFPSSDGSFLREVVWLRNVSNWARGEAVDDLGRAKQLFDWTIRNVQLEWDVPAPQAGAPSRVLQEPWETLLFGRGTATDRAWLFILLARQQGIDAALLGVKDPGDPNGNRVQPWVVAVQSGGELYLFDPALGLPIPAPGGLRCDAAGALDVKPATLRQVAADGTLLEQLDVDAEHRYPVDPSQVTRTVVLLEASPAYLSQRMKLLEPQLAGDAEMVVCVDPTAQAEPFQASPQVVDVRLWSLPYETILQERRLGPERDKWQMLQFIPFSLAFDVSSEGEKRSGDAGGTWQWWTPEARLRSSRPYGTGLDSGQSDSGQRQRPVPALWRARLLHFKGQFKDQPAGDKGAIYYYMKARLPDRVLESPQLDPNARLALVWAKTCANYWLGLIAAEQGDRAKAVDWLDSWTLNRSQGGSLPGGQEGSPWAPGATYNLARVYEADGQITKAIQTYRADTQSAYRPGNLLRARWLESLASRPSQGGTQKGATKASEPPSEDRPQATATAPQKNGQVRPGTDSPERPTREVESP